MKQKSLLVAVLAVAMAVVIAVTCILVFAGPAKPVFAEGEQQTDAADAATTETSYPSPAAWYDFTVRGFSPQGWTVVDGNTTDDNTVTVTTGTGLTIPTAINNARLGYATANPLKGKLTDAGFSVIMNASVTAGVNDFETLFGFNMSADPNTNAAKFFAVMSNGSGVRLNITAVEGENSYYDIIGKSVVNMEEMTQYILTVSPTAITIYSNGEQVQQYTWFTRTAESTAVPQKGAFLEYSYETIDYVNTADYFNIGIATSIWGNGGMTVENAAFYDAPLTADEIAAINANLPDLTALDALFEKTDLFSITNYDTTQTGWTEAYAAYTAALDTAENLSILSATQEQVNSAVSDLQSAYTALDAFLRTQDLTNGLVAAFPLNSTAGGTNIKTNSTQSADLVSYMNGSNGAGAVTATEPLTSSDRFATYQGVNAAKLFDEQHLNTYQNPNPYADLAATSNTMGLSIPHSAFNGVTAQGGLTLSFNAYIENFYSGDWGRLFQLGNYQFATEQNAQIFLAVNGVLAFDDASSGKVENVIPNTSPMCSILAKQWYSLSLVLDPAYNTVTLYLSGYQLEDGAIVYKFGWSTVTVTQAQLAVLIVSIADEGAENWLGRSFWDDADRSVVGAVSNLSVYSRALSANEVNALHNTADLSTLMEQA